MIQFGNGHISAQELWSVAKNSVTSSFNVIDNDSSPIEFIADIDFEKSFEIMSTVYDEAINKRLFPFKKDGGIVGIDYMTRPLNAQR